MVLILKFTKGQEQFESKSSMTSVNYIAALKDTLNRLAEKSDNEYLKIHCSSMISVIESKNTFTRNDSVFLMNTYNAFNDNSDTSNAKELSTYLNRKRPFILSWISPTDGAVSFSWLKPPKNWDPENSYPLYIELHGLWSVASNSIEYMTYPYLSAASSSFAYEDGYLLSPWGRGNMWYQGISETDIWEGMAALEEIVKIDPSRKYLNGHSMGGFGSWYIAGKSPNTWAALGIHAGALQYNTSLVSSEVANILKDLPTYFVCGTNDGLLSINQTAYHLLEDAGNPNIEFVTFVGAHDYHQENVENMYLWMRDFVNDNWNTGINEPSEISLKDPVIRTYPNPVSNFVHIAYNISENSPVNISIYDIYGRKTVELVNNMKVPGEYEVVFDATNLTAGIYLIYLKSGGLTVKSELVVIK